MNFDKPPTSIHEQIPTDQEYEKELLPNGETRYIFYDKGVVIGWKYDTSITDLPELFFVTAQGTKEDGSKNFSMERLPEAHKEANMHSVIECMQRVIEDTHIRKFWFHPYGEKNPEGQNNKKIELARTRLFQRAAKAFEGIANIEMDKQNGGYILDIYTQKQTTNCFK